MGDDRRRRRRQSRAARTEASRAAAAGSLALASHGRAPPATWRQRGGLHAGLGCSPKTPGIGSSSSYPSTWQPSNQMLDRIFSIPVEISRRCAWMRRLTWALQLRDRSSKGEGTSSLISSPDDSSAETCVVRPAAYWRRGSATGSTTGAEKLGRRRAPQPTAWTWTGVSLRCAARRLGQSWLVYSLLAQLRQVQSTERLVGEWRRTPTGAVAGWELVVKPPPCVWEDFFFLPKPVK
jgi:hypothetical protein